MKSLDIIIKMNDRALEEKRRELVECEEQKEQLEGYTKKMDRELEAERQFIDSDPMFGAHFLKYKDTIKKRQALIAKSIIDINDKMFGINQEIIFIFSEVKKYETIRKNKILQQEKEAKIKEGKELDEIAINNYLGNLI